jgi:hypothetical protein
MRIQAIRKIDTKPSRCIEVSGDKRLYASGGNNGRSVISHNSVSQRNIIFSCILRPERWRFLGIDLKKVELSQFRKYSNVVLGIATEREDAVTIMNFAHQTMMKRYSEMEQLGINDFRDLPDPGYSLLIMVDEASTLFNQSGIKGSDQAKEDDAMAAECQVIVGSIARLGRAAGVHLILATQRPDAKLIPGELKANLAVRITCGRATSTASTMVLENSEGTRVKPFPRGRLYLQINGYGAHAQGFYAETDWMDKYLEDKGLNPDGTPISNRQSRLAHLADMSEFDGTDLDERSGIDNSAVIDRIREEEQNEDFSAPSDDMERPQIGLGSRKTSRPEDDWDSFMDEITEDAGM